MPLENGRADDERVSRGQASERAVCVCEAVCVEKGARRPPLPAAVVCPPGGRLAVTAGVCLLQFCSTYYKTVRVGGGETMEDMGYERPRGA
jgi:hypothetical protein